jgi:hypothetical protein
MSLEKIAKSPPRVSSTPDSPKSLRSPLLPGNRRSPTVTYRGVDDQRVSIDLDQLDRDLLQALAAKPLGKWELREALHVAEAVIGRQLRGLRARGLVKIIGRQLARRKWALVSYQAPAYVQGQVPTHPDALTAITRAKPESRGSWWTDPAFRTAGKGGGA